MAIILLLGFLGRGRLIHSKVFLCHGLMEVIGLSLKSFKIRKGYLILIRLLFSLETEYTCFILMRDGLFLNFTVNKGVPWVHITDGQMMKGVHGLNLACCQRKTFASPMVAVPRTVIYFFPFIIKQ